MLTGTEPLVQLRGKLAVGTQREIAVKAVCLVVVDLDVQVMLIEWNVDEVGCALDYQRVNVHREASVKAIMLTY